jgi:hypothetical protein
LPHQQKASLTDWFFYSQEVADNRRPGYDILTQFEGSGEA